MQFYMLKTERKGKKTELAIWKEFTQGGRTNFKHFRMENKPEKGLYSNDCLKSESEPEKQYWILKAFQEDRV